MDDETDPPTDADWIVLDALWSGVVNGWEDEGRHTKFLDHARTIGALPEAARRYGRLREDAERGELAKKRLNAIAMVATNELYATRTPVSPRKTPNWLLFVAVVVCASLLGWAAWAFGLRGR